MSTEKKHDTSYNDMVELPISIHESDDSYEDSPKLPIDHNSDSMDDMFRKELLWSNKIEDAVIERRELCKDLSKKHFEKDKKSKMVV